MVEVEELGADDAKPAQQGAFFARAQHEIDTLEARARRSNRRILANIIKKFERAASEQTDDEVIDALRRELRGLRGTHDPAPALADDVVIGNLQQELKAVWRHNADCHNAAAPPPVSRRYSSKSANTLKQLEAIEHSMGGLEKLSDGAETQLEGSPSRPLLQAHPPSVSSKALPSRPLEHCFRRTFTGPEGTFSKRHSPARPLPPSRPLLQALRSELAQVHGDCTKLLSTGGALVTVGAPPLPHAPAALDGISTGELVSGQQNARAKRKALVGRAQALSSRIEDQVQHIDQLLAAAPKRPSGRT